MELARVRAQLDRILTSAAFHDADRPSSFLRFIVNRTLEDDSGDQGICNRCRGLRPKLIFRFEN